MKTLGWTCLSAISFAAACEKQAPPAFERPPASVSVVTAVAGDVPVYLDEIGKCVAREVVSIQPQVSGRITEIHFSDGADLKAGDALFTIDPRPYQAQLAAMEATRDQMKAALDLSRIEFTRVANLVETTDMSKSDYDSRKSAVDVSEAQLKQSQAAAETARLNLEYCSISSPIDGRAGQRLVDLGNVVTPASDAPLLVIQRLDPIYADFSVTENDLTRVQQNMAQGTLKVEVRLPDEPRDPRPGELTFLDNAVQESGTVKLRATIPNSDRRFWPGRFVKVRLVLSTRHEAVLVPAVAVQMSARGPFVYVVKEDSTAELRLVTTGQRQGSLVVIEEGLKAGEQVVLNGQVAVTPGGKVRIETLQASERSPAAGGKS